MINLEYWLIKKGMTATDLQRKTELTLNTIVNIKNGKIKKSNTKTLGQIASGLEITVSELMKEV